MTTSHTGPLGSRPTGAWLSEITHPWQELTAAGYRVDYASPMGGEPPIDPMSAVMPSRSRRAFTRTGERSRLAESMRTLDVDPSRYDGLFLAGGHGALWDFPADPGLKLAAEAIWRAGGVIGAVCHGPAGLLQLRDEKGEILIRDRSVTSYSNLEERISGTTAKVPFLLEDALEKAGASFRNGLVPFGPHVIATGRLVTGQNPMSARGVARGMLRVMAREQHVEPHPIGVPLPAAR